MWTNTFDSWLDLSGHSRYLHNKSLLSNTISASPVETPTNSPPSQRFHPSIVTIWLFYIISSSNYYEHREQEETYISHDRWGWHDQQAWSWGIPNPGDPTEGEEIRPPVLVIYYVCIWSVTRYCAARRVNSRRRSSPRRRSTRWVRGSSGYWEAIYLIGPWIRPRFRWSTELHVIKYSTAEDRELQKECQSSSKQFGWRTRATDTEHIEATQVSAA